MAFKDSIGIAVYDTTDPESMKGKKIKDEIEAYIAKAVPCFFGVIGTKTDESIHSDTKKVYEDQFLIDEDGEEMDEEDTPVVHHQLSAKNDTKSEIEEFFNDVIKKVLERAGE